MPAIKTAPYLRRAYERWQVNGPDGLDSGRLFQSAHTWRVVCHHQKKQSYRGTEAKPNFSELHLRATENNVRTRQYTPSTVLPLQSAPKNPANVYCVTLSESHGMVQRHASIEPPEGRATATKQSAHGLGKTQHSPAPR